MFKIPVTTWIANAAARLTGTRGEITPQAESVDCSRQTVYEHAAKVRAAVEAEHAGGPTRAQLLQTRDELRGRVADRGVAHEAGQPVLDPGLVVLVDRRP